MTPDPEPLRVLLLTTDLAKGGGQRFVIDLTTEFCRRDDVEVIIGALYEHDLYQQLTADLPIEQLHFQTFSPRGRNECPAYSELLRTFRPHVVHTHRFLAEFLSSYSVSPDIAYICHGHDNMVQLERPSWRTLSSRDGLTNLLERWHLVHYKYKRVPTAFVANSTDTLEYFRRVLPHHMRDDVVLLPLGFNYGRFARPQPAPPDPGERLRLINVGSFEAKKNQIFFVEIARELQRRGVDFEINLLGDGPEREVVRASVLANGLERRILLHGNVDNVEDWLGNSHVYVHAARYEPFGLVFLEAMAAGLPCVALDGSGNRDVIEHGQNGFLLEGQDPSAFADRVVELTENPTRYGDMSGYAQTFAKRYDISAAADRFVEFYRARVNLARNEVTTS